MVGGGVRDGRTKIPSLIERQTVPTHVRTPSSKPQLYHHSPYVRSHSGGGTKNLSPTRRMQTGTSPPRGSPRNRQSAATKHHHHHHHTNLHHHHVNPRDVDLRESRDPPPSSTDAVSDEDEPVCEYDTSATVLYELLESSNWEKARNRCRSHPEEVRTWIVRKDRSLQVRWKLLPLHAAIIFQSPNFVVSALLERYPIASSRRDDQGMLPLHLAFRHKQEDEDLLELLLVQFPKAVMLKDRRERVPLEHGRDSKFSAKLMRLYADATVAASRATGGINNSNINNADNINAGNGGNNAGAITALEKQIESMETDHERKVNAIKADYKDRINKLKEQHDSLLSATKEENKMALRQAKLVSEEERQSLVDQHKEEVAEVRVLLTKQADKDKALAEALESEIAHLEVALQDAVNERDRTTKQFDRTKAYADELEGVLRKIGKEQDTIHQMVAQQQDSLLSAQTRRNELIKALMKQEDGDGANDRVHGSRMIDAIDKIRRKVERTLEPRPTSPRGTTSPRGDRAGIVDGNGGVGLNDGVGVGGVTKDVVQSARIERERERGGGGEHVLYAVHEHEEDRNTTIYNSPHQQDRMRSAAEDIYYLGGSPQPGENEHYISSEEVTYGNHHHNAKTDSKPQENDGDVRVIGDEISAITDNSDF